MKKRRIKFFITFILLVLVGVIAINALAYNHAWSMLRFSTDSQRTDRPENLTLYGKVEVLVSGVTIPRPVGTQTPRNHHLDFQEGLIDCADGIQLGYWHIPCPGASKIILMFHSYGGEKSSLLGEAKTFYDLGYATVLVDFRGSGASSENYTTIGYHEAGDVAEALHFVRKSFPYQRHFLFGQSMGSVAVLRALHSETVQPDGIIIEGVFDEVLHTVEHRFEAMGVPSFPSARLLLFWSGQQFGFDAFDHNPVTYAKSAACPAVFLHGTEDVRAQVDEARRVFDAIPTTKRFYEFKGLGHQSYVGYDPQRWKKAVQWLIDQSDE
ncbi:MAG: alpha/beta fold hydrolase [Verrucomicrobia bacterium]|nr:alpha/beta fold hydrolase [Verrucomicrobiota bacterium]